jgi:hypothetical protein
LEKGISTDIETGLVKIRDPIRKTATFFEEKHGWDKLAARTIWAFGPDDMGPNILQNDTLLTSVSPLPNLLKVSGCLLMVCSYRLKRKSSLTR